jgi:hypothetical protein
MSTRRRHGVGTVQLLLFVCAASLLRLPTTADAHILRNPACVLSRIIFLTLRASKATAVERRALSASSNAPAPPPLPTPTFARSEANRRDHRQVQQLPPSTAPAAAAPATTNTASPAARPTAAPRPARPTSAPRPGTATPTNVIPSTVAPSASRRPSILPSANLTVTPTVSSRPSRFPSQSPRPSMSDPPSMVPSQKLSEDGLPSALPSAMPSVTHQLLHQPFLQMVLDGVDRDWNNRGM